MVVVVVVVAGRWLWDGGCGTVVVGWWLQDGGCGTVVVGWWLRDDRDGFSYTGNFIIVVTIDNDDEDDDDGGGDNNNNHAKTMTVMAMTIMTAMVPIRENTVANRILIMKNTVHMGC